MRNSLSVLVLLVLTNLTSTIQAQLSTDSSHSKRSDWKLPAAVATAYGATTFLIYRYGDMPIRTYAQSHKSGWKTTLSCAVSDFGLGRTQTIGLVTAAATGWIFKDARLKKTAIIWLGGLLVNGGITDGIKTTFQRHRPNTGDPYNTFDWRNGPRLHRSFVSAHTSNIFTTATVLSLNYRHKKWVAPAAYGLATLVGLSRIYDDAHWASDVLAGAAVGYLSARLVHFLYGRLSRKIQLLPQPGLKGGAVRLVYQW